MTPQPEESPDEILASEIAFKHERIAFLERVLLTELTPELHKQYIKQLEFWMAGVSRDESYQTLRKVVLDQVKSDERYFGRPVETVWSVALRQSDDAIRGMRG